MGENKHERVSGSSTSLAFLDLVKFAMWNIHKSSSIDDILSTFGTRVQEITDVRMSDSSILMTSRMFMGQKKYFYSFRESDELHGEFNIDLLPSDANDYMRSAITSLAGHQSDAPTPSMRMANFRAQLFSSGFFGRGRITRKCDEITGWIENDCGPKNTNRELTEELSQMAGCAVACWVKEWNETSYIVTVYVLPRRSCDVPSLSFSISEA